MADEIRTEKLLPVLVGYNYEHVMGRAEIVQTPDSVVITITSKGADARELGDFVASSEIVALSFVGIPIRQHDAHHKENM